MLYRSQKSTSINKHCLCRQRKWPCPDPWQVHVEGKQRTRGRVRLGGAKGQGTKKRGSAQNPGNGGGSTEMKTNPSLVWVTQLTHLLSHWILTKPQRQTQVLFPF